MEKVSAPKKKIATFPFFRTPLSPIPDQSQCPSSPAAREPKSVASPFDLQSKKEAMMQKANGDQDLDKDGQDGEKAKVTLRSWFKVVVSGASRSWCDANVD
ncbi:hypothetical protein [Absidia glauca]|uniref:Uncharacterized protein n=1 Tax=Absidia glauca TaxID=4829 RepID=A0A168SHP7_ABSGL|nr:hypothetical protein [Absidia glauca]